jgi:hypothetical protein
LEFLFHQYSHASAILVRLDKRLSVNQPIDPALFETQPSDLISHNGCLCAGDALRPFLMHAFGGLYLDLDVSCYWSSEPFLLGHDIVFQSEFSGEADVNNAVVASVPGHPFWNAVIRNITLVVAPSCCQGLGKGPLQSPTFTGNAMVYLGFWVEAGLKTPVHRTLWQQLGGSS